MFPLSAILEKSLLPVDGRPVIRHIIDNLKKAKNVEGIHICCLDKHIKQFEHEFRDENDVEIIGFEKPVGTARTVIDVTDNCGEDFIMIHYADCLTEIDYDDFISKIDPKYHGLIAVTNSVKHDYSEVSFTRNDSLVQDFVEKPNLINYSWSGIALVNQLAFRQAWSYVGADTHGYKDIATHIFPRMIKLGTLKAYPYHGYWFDMGNLNSYRKVCALYDNRSNGDVKL